MADKKRLEALAASIQDLRETSHSSEKWDGQRDAMIESIFIAILQELIDLRKATK